MKGICFKEPLFLQVPLGLKTQTRRLIFPDTDYTYFSQPSFEGMETDPTDCYKLDKNGDMLCYKDGEPKLVTFKGTYGLFEGDQFYFDNSYVRPRYQPNEIVYLKEPYFISEVIKDKIKHITYRYANGDWSLYPNSYWRNKLFMPEKYARYFIKIINVRAEHAHDITEADAIAEGCKNRAEFEGWWIKIHGFSSWKDNSWVWVYDFEYIKNYINN